MSKLLDQLAARDPKYNKAGHKGKNIKGLSKSKLMDIIQQSLEQRKKK